MRLSVAYNDRSIGIIQSLIRSYMAEAWTCVNGHSHPRPALCFFNQIVVFCEYSETSRTWWWKFRDGKHTEIPLYHESILLGNTIESMTRELVYKSVYDFLKRIVERNWIDAFKGKSMSFYYWEYLRLCVCLKHHLPGASTRIEMSVVRACNDALDILTKREMDDIALEERLIPGGVYE